MIAFVLAAMAAALAACGTPLELGSTQQATVVPIQNQNFTFPDTSVGSASAPDTITISPVSGEQSDTITDISMACTSFALANVPALPATVSSHCAGESYGSCTGWQTMTQTFDATFVPIIASPQPVTCVVYVTLDGATPSTSCDIGVHQCVTLAGRGINPPVAVVASPSPVAFGEVRTNDIGTSMVTLTNNGSDPAGAMVTSVAVTPAAFSLVSGNAAPHMLAFNGGFENDVLGCSPGSATGPITGTLTVGVAGIAPVVANLTCTGVMSNLRFLDATLTESESPAHFIGDQPDGSTRIGEPLDLTIELENDGSATTDLVIHSVAVTDPELSITSGPTPETSLVPGASTPVVIHYSAATYHMYGTIDQLQVNIDNNVTRSTTLVGGAQTTSMSVNPDGTYDFGPVCIGTTATETFYVQQSALGTFHVTGITPPSAPFSMIGPQPTTQSPVEIAGQAAPFTVQVAPTAAGTGSDSFKIVTDIPGSAPHKIRLAVTAIPAGVTATPAMLDFGAVAIGVASVPQMVTLANCSGADVAITSAHVVGANASEFLIALEPQSATMASGSVASYSLLMTPKLEGNRTAQLQIAYAGGMVTIPLVGTGTNAPGATLGSATYYTCSAGGSGAGSWPLGCALAVLGASRRRRRRRCAR